MAWSFSDCTKWTVCLISLHHSNHCLLLPGCVRVEANALCVFVMVPKIRWSLFYLSQNLHRSKQNTGRTTRMSLPGFPHPFRNPLRAGQVLLMNLEPSLLRLGAFPNHSLPLPLWPGACCLQIAVDIVYLVSNLSERGGQNKTSSDDIRPPLGKKNPFCLWRWSAKTQNQGVDIMFVHSERHWPLHCLLDLQGKRQAGSQTPRPGEPSLIICPSTVLSVLWQASEDGCKTLLCQLLWFPLKKAGKLFMGDISELPLLHFIKCLSLNNAVAILFLLSANYIETRLMIGFDFQLCETWLQICT